MIKIIQNIINSILGLLNLKFIKATHVVNSNNQGYISAKETILSAKKGNLSVGDYVEKIWDQVGEAQKAIDNMDKLAA